MARCEADLRTLGLTVPPGGGDPGTEKEWEDLTRLPFVALFRPDRPVGPWVAAADHRADLVRDVFGNPFRPVAFDPGWRTDTAVALARGMYDARDFDRCRSWPTPSRTPGATTPTCRPLPGRTPHVRGCWVVDLVLGKG